MMSRTNVIRPPQVARALHWLAPPDFRDAADHAHREWPQVHIEAEFFRVVTATGTAATAPNTNLAPLRASPGDAASQESAGDSNEEHVRVVGHRLARPRLFKVAIVIVVEPPKGTSTRQPFDLLNRPIKVLDADVGHASPDTDRVVLSVEVVVGLEIASDCLVPSGNNQADDLNHGVTLVRRTTALVFPVADLHHGSHVTMLDGESASDGCHRTGTAHTGSGTSQPPNVKIISVRPVFAPTSIAKTNCTRCTDLGARGQWPPCRAQPSQREGQGVRIAIAPLIKTSSDQL